MRVVLNEIRQSLNSLLYNNEFKNIFYHCVQYLQKDITKNK